MFPVSTLRFNFFKNCRPFKNLPPWLMSISFYLIKPTFACIFCNTPIPFPTTCCYKQELNAHCCCHFPVSIVSSCPLLDHFVGQLSQAEEFQHCFLVLNIWMLQGLHFYNYTTMQAATKILGENGN